MSRFASVFGCRRDAEKVPPQTKSVPQRLKPRRQQSSYGTAEAVPLSKTDFSASSEAPRFIPKATAKEQLCVAPKVLAEKRVSPLRDGR
jgi:hypothetical protein